MKSILRTALFLTAIVTSLSGFAHSLDKGPHNSSSIGGVGTGGGNAINGHLIEDYLKEPFTQLPDFKATMEPFLQQLEAKIPELGVGLRKSIQEQNWYLVPVKIAELSRELTGLNFSSEQTAYQTGTEIFISAKDLPASASARGTLYKHEALMAYFHSTPAKTRQLLGYLVKHPNLDPLDLRLKLEEIYPVTGFGYFTRAEVVGFEELKSVISAEIKAICQSGQNENEIGKILWAIDSYYSFGNDNQPFALYLPVTNAKIASILSREGMNAQNGFDAIASILGNRLTGYIIEKIGNRNGNTAERLVEGCRKLN